MRHAILFTVAAFSLALPGTGYSKDKQHGHGGGGGGGGGGTRQVQRNYGGQQHVQRRDHSPGRQNAVYRGSNSQANYRSNRSVSSHNYRSQRNYSQHNYRAHRSFSSRGSGNWFTRNYRHRDDDDHHHHHHSRNYYSRNYYSYNRGYYPYYGAGYGYGYPYYGYGYGYPRSSLSVAYYSQPAYAYRGNEADEGDNLAADVQRELQRRGYYRGYIDGQIGAGSRAAIRAYQAEHGLAPTGRIDSRLLDSLDID